MTLQEALDLLRLNKLKIVDTYVLHKHICHSIFLTVKTDMFVFANDDM